MSFEEKSPRILTPCPEFLDYSNNLITESVFLKVQAEQLGVNPKFLTQIRTGYAQPGKALILRIEKWSGEVVSRDHWVKLWNLPAEGGK